MNFIIRTLDFNDYHDLYLIWSDKKITDMTGTIPGMTLQDSKIRVERTIADLESTPFVIECRGFVAGIINLQRNTTHNRQHVASISLMINSSYQGQGLGKALLQKVINFVKVEDVSVKVIELECYTDNDRAIELYTKFGFEREGVLRKRAIRNEEVKDLLVMSRIL